MCVLHILHVQLITVSEIIDDQYGRYFMVLLWCFVSVQAFETLQQPMSHTLSDDDDDHTRLFNVTCSRVCVCVCVCLCFTCFIHRRVQAPTWDSGIWSYLADELQFIGLHLSPSRQISQQDLNSPPSTELFTLMKVLASARSCEHMIKDSLWCLLCFLNEVDWRLTAVY